MTMARLLPDPPSRTGGILTKRELDAALRVLETLRRPQPATVVMSWDNDMQDALGGLQRARYVETRAAYGGRAPSKASASFRPDVLATTDLGSEYLASIKAAPLSQGRNHATVKRGSKKSPAQLDREIAAALGKKAPSGRSSHATRAKGPPSWEEIAADYKRRAKAARDAGGKVKIYPDGSILVVPTAGSDEYFYQDWQADELRQDIERRNREVLDHVRFEDLVLAQSQDW